LQHFSPSLDFLFGHIQQLLFGFGAKLSLSSLACALVIAAGFYICQRAKRGRRIRARTLLRALFPRHILRSRSNQADIGYLLFNVFVFGLALGWAILSYQFVTNAIIAGLVALFGPVTRSALPVIVSRGAITLMLFLAYELGYWFNHWLSHKVPLLWEFHKVHHTAEVLTPLTNFRVHPAYALLFANILALSTAIANGFGHYWFGDTTYQYAVNDTNLILVLFIHAYVHLQHSQVWIAFRGVLGCIFISPAHHQIHHSDRPEHYNSNYGSCLALWDWMFGTLYIPQQERQPLRFGVAGHTDAHTVKAEMLRPFAEAAGHLKPLLPARKAREPEHEQA
jgi:sterol desaturase/sphingolipid hydroxylase (fatty acid hydroxylase superfamily)